MGDSGTMEAAAEKAPLDMREQTSREHDASRHRFDAAARADALLTQLVCPSAVCGRQRPHHDIHVRQRVQHIQPYDFAQPSFHAIPLDCRMRIARNDDACPGMTQKGSDVPNLEVRGPESLPL